VSAVQLTNAALPVGADAANGRAQEGHHAPRGASRPAAARPARRGLPATAETWLALGVVVVVALLIMPLPPFLLDGFLALSMALSILVLLVTLSSRDPLEFNIFPSLLLLITLLRLGLNVCSTRLILGTGHAGQVIAAFGNFVIGGNVVVGLVIFVILVVINSW
jgi:flagellar biosynthesis protein FlhA